SVGELATAVAAPRRRRELQAAAVAVAGVGRPVAAGLALGHRIPHRPAATADRRLALLAAGRRRLGGRGWCEGVHECSALLVGGRDEHDEVALLFARRDEREIAALLVGQGHPRDVRLLLGRRVGVGDERLLRRRERRRGGGRRRRRCVAEQ